APVDQQTLFCMASTTKAVVALGLAMLVDEGKLSWQDRVIDHVPYFQLSDPYVTKEARVKDLLTHNLGLGNADLLWAANELSTAETIKRMQHAPMAYSMRGNYIYQNIMYAVAGEVIQAVSGKPWDIYLRQKVFKPLGMEHTVTRAQQVKEARNKTTPHNTFDERMITLPYVFSDAIGPAGMIWSSIEDMTKYLQFLTQGGVYEGDTLISSATFNYLFEPHALIPESRFYPTTKLTNPHWTSYGLGWFQHDYKGVKVDFHTGSLPGLIAINGQLRDQELAVYVFGNMDHAELRHAIMYKVFDLYALGGDRDWHQEIFALYQGFKEQQVKQLAKDEESRVGGTAPSVPLEAYTGKFRHPMYGDVVISLSDGKLQLSNNNKLIVALNHWHYNTFKTEQLLPFLIYPADVHFSIGRDGEVASLNFLGASYDRIE
ncbi:MAG: serine hydrolase, partial [Fulvivirga sp.]|nr:serine hydrolase [Fulvivirga sp.]